MSPPLKWQFILRTRCLTLRHSLPTSSAVWIPTCLVQDLFSPSDESPGSTFSPTASSSSSHGALHLSHLCLLQLSFPSHILLKIPSVIHLNISCSLCLWEQWALLENHLMTVLMGGFANLQFPTCPGGYWLGYSCVPGQVRLPLPSSSHSFLTAPPSSLADDIALNFQDIYLSKNKPLISTLMPAVKLLESLYFYLVGIDKIICSLLLAFILPIVQTNANLQMYEGCLNF